MTVTEAHCFAEWVCLQARLSNGKVWVGRLPSAAQWDKAGGKREGVLGPYRADRPVSEIAVDLFQPRPVGTSPADISLFGCLDMAGNGREFTRTVPDTELFVPLPAPRKGFRGDTVTVRGREFDRPHPFRFRDAAQAVDYNETAEDLGFRVVIELPPES
jgi:formylglycine-generating enzyme required for sulfatase activity